MTTQIRSTLIFSDNHIMLQVKAGELQKLGLLYERHKKALFGFCYKMTRSTTVSEDLVQTVFMKILNGRDGFVGDGQFVTWMFHIARNAILDHHRKHKHAHLQVVDAAVNELAGAEDLAVKHEADEQLQRWFKAIDALSEDKRAVLIMSRFEHLKYKDIAAVLGCSEGAVKMKMRRILIELRVHYQQIETGAQHVAR